MDLLFWTPGSMTFKMTYFSIGLSAAFVLLQLFFLGCSEAQDFGEQCLEKYKKGRENFVLDADESVNDGATFIASPKVQRDKECVRSCCKDPKCNVAFMENTEEEGLIKSCFLFNCLYKKEYVCRFVKKTGYTSYILDTVYESHLADKPPPSKILIHTKNDVDSCSWNTHYPQLNLHLEHKQVEEGNLFTELFCCLR